MKQIRKKRWKNDDDAKAYILKVEKWKLTKGLTYWAAWDYLDPEMEDKRGEKKKQGQLEYQ